MTNLGKTIPRPTESELELLRIVWEKEPATVRDIYDALNLVRRGMVLPRFVMMYETLYEAFRNYQRKSS